MIIQSPNMSLPVPSASIDDGPQWASDIQNSLNIIDAHTHAPGSGVPITPNGLNINSDLPLNFNNLTSINSLTLAAASGTPSDSSIYGDGTDLFYRDGAGNAVQITRSGAVTGATGTITGLPSGTASASYLSGTFTFQQATSTAANIDAASLIIRYPGSYPAPAGNYILLQAPSSLATGYSLTLPATLPGSRNFLAVDNTGTASYIDNDGVTISTSGNELHVPAGGISATQLATDSVTTIKIQALAVTTAKLDNLGVTTGKVATGAITNNQRYSPALVTNPSTGAIGDIARSNAVVSTTFNSGSVTAISDAAILSTTGRATMVFVVGDSTGVSQITQTSGTVTLQLFNVGGGYVVSSTQLTAGQYLSPGGLLGIDIPGGSAGAAVTSSYTLRAQTTVAGNTVFTNVRVAAYQL